MTARYFQVPMTSIELEVRRELRRRAAMWCYPQVPVFLGFERAGAHFTATFERKLQ